MEDRKAGLRAPAEAHGVGVGKGGGDHPLPVFETLHRAEPVAKLGGFFKAELRSRLLHLLAKLLHQLPALAVEDEGHLHHAAAVVLGAAVSETPARAGAHVVVEAGPLLPDVAREFAGAVRQQQGLRDRGDDVAGLAPAAEGAEVARPVLPRAALDRERGVLLPHVKADEGIALVVLEEDVVVGLVPLDEGVFEHEGLKLAPRDDDVEVPHLVHHGGDLRQVLAVEIARDAVFELLGLADVDDLIVLVKHDVHARQQRQAVCLVS